ncbi:hypothetical protein NECAME_05801 [Necator americanus]|uniref:Uncharacterized protein n=1 Tax=Necator americanus TaxID=51031 RepID=W2TYT7_NECAM|nr:hypothetical protein NECAME_05801 [Necator americanus]ETN86809.1 hypothetical protein NECAME_05801 [Necator americanus]
MRDTATPRSEVAAVVFVYSSTCVLARPPSAVVINLIHICTKVPLGYCIIRCYNECEINEMAENEVRAVEIKHQKWSPNATTPARIRTRDHSSDDQSIYHCTTEKVLLHYFKTLNIYALDAVDGVGWAHSIARIITS